MTTQTIRSVPRGVTSEWHDASSAASRQRAALAHFPSFFALDQRVFLEHSVVRDCAFVTAMSAMAAA
jgi:hypothetical protein